MARARLIELPQRLAEALAGLVDDVIGAVHPQPDPIPVPVRTREPRR